MVKNYEFVAVWLEGIALVLILGADLREYRKQNAERLESRRQVEEQLNAQRKQMHADCVFGIPLVR